MLFGSFPQAAAPIHHFKANQTADPAPSLPTSYARAIHSLMPASMTKPGTTRHSVSCCWGRMGWIHVKSYFKMHNGHSLCSVSMYLGKKQKIGCCCACCLCMHVCTWLALRQSATRQRASSAVRRRRKTCMDCLYVYLFVGNCLLWCGLVVAVVVALGQWRVWREGEGSRYPI